MPHYYSTTKIDLKYKEKPQRKLLIKLQITLVIKGVHPDDAMKTERVDCVCIKTPKNVSKDLYITTR